MKVKTQNLIGPALDWAVENALLVDRVANPEQRAAIASRNRRTHTEVFSYQLNWAQGGPIIDRERIGVYPSQRGEYAGLWAARPDHTKQFNFLHIYGPTPLIAAMRCYVASKLGNEVDIPKELL